MLDFAAIDFETANQYRSSVCSVGIVIYRNGKECDSFYSLIKPAPNFYTSFTTAIHGLTRKDTDRAPYFPEVWYAAQSHIGSLPLIAHNRAFDENCLKAVFEHYALPYPHYRFYCTLTESRRTSPLSTYKLATVAAYLGYSAFDHHNALADARACAYIASRLWSENPV